MIERLIVIPLTITFTLFVGIGCMAQVSEPLSPIAEPGDPVLSSPAAEEVNDAVPTASTAGPDAVMTADLPENQASATNNLEQPPTLTPIPTFEPAAFEDTPTPVSLPVVQLDGITFAVIGDYGSDFPGSHDVAALVHSWSPDFIITVGDNNYPDGAAETIAANITQHYGDYIDQGRFFPALGNHDYYTDGAQPYFDYFNLPNNERYYYFVRGDVHFFAVNSDWNEPDGISQGSTQAAWLQEALANSTTQWQVVYFHTAPFASREESQVSALRWPFAPGALIWFCQAMHMSMNGC